MTKKVIKEVEEGKSHFNTFSESEGEIVTLISRDKLGHFKVELQRLMKTSLTFC